MSKINDLFAGTYTAISNNKKIIIFLGECGAGFAFLVVL
jgi:hypothetical protein